jgi:hypothetical protein
MRDSRKGVTTEASHQFALVSPCEEYLSIRLLKLKDAQECQKLAIEI